MDRASANKVESNKISESAKDITKDHKINGSDGGLTQAEQNQLIAAGLDLSGVVASLFGPVGNIAGAATGAECGRDAGPCHRGGGKGGQRQPEKQLRGHWKDDPHGHRQAQAPGMGAHLSGGM